MRVGLLLKGVELSPLGSVRERLMSRMQIFEAEKEHKRFVALVSSMAAIMGTLSKDNVPKVEKIVSEHRDLVFNRDWSKEKIKETYRKERTTEELMDIVSRMGGK